MNGQSWKVAIMGPAGIASDGYAFELLYAFTSREEAEEHVGYFSHTGTRLDLCDGAGLVEPSRPAT